MVKPGCPDLQLSDIQGNILRGYPSSRATYIFYSFGTPEAGRALLGALLARVRDATDWGERRPATAVNVAFTFAGLDALDVDPATLALLPDAFRVPMAERATMLDDRGPSAPGQWDAGLGDGTAHLLVTVNQTRKDVEAFEAFTAEVAQVKAAATTAGAVLRHEQLAEALEARREHFGWADGFGQPAIAGVDTDAVGGSPQKDGSWAFAAPGEFVHGQPNEDGTTASDPTAALLRNGTFMVYRKLYQDVVAFRARLHADAVAYGATLTDDPPLTDDQLYELTAAKVVGRWRDGMPIEDGERRPPGEEDAYLGSKAQKNPSNDFRYRGTTSDLDGHVCPIGAHIRRTNPRDALGWEGGSEMTSTHRIIRRGMPYGKPFADFTPGETDDKIDRGLIFICFNASIERQFEVVQRQWCNDGNAFALGNQKDYILGDRLLDPLTGLPTATGERDGRRGCPDFSIQSSGHAPFCLDQGTPVVMTRGSEYLLMPGLTVLQQLASGRLDQMRRGEEAAIDEVVRLSEVGLAKTFPPGSPHVTRDQHAKAHGCVHATFEVLDGLPDELRVGLFDRPRTYDAWIRFSSRASNRTAASDKKNDVHGMAIKVLGVDGPKILANERDATTHDFVLANSDTFFSRNANEYVELATKIARGTAGLVLFAIPSFDPRRWRVRQTLGIVRAVGHEVSNPLQIRYWSQTPFALGPLAVKYSARPQPNGAPAPQTGVDTDDGLEQAIARQLVAGVATFDFMVQRQTDPKAMPVEDPTVRWDEKASPFVTVATIHIPSQSFQSPARKALGEDLSFTPWHALPAHEPLGGINRVRRSVYESVSSTRHDRNGVERSEPTEFKDC